VAKKLIKRSVKPESQTTFTKKKTIRERGLTPFKMSDKSEKWLEEHTFNDGSIIDDGDLSNSTQEGRAKANKLMEKIPDFDDSTDSERWLIKHGVKPADAAAIFVEDYEADT